MDNRAWFNNLAGDWDSMMDKEKNKVLEEIINGLEIAPGSVILDVGTGTGLLVPWLVQAASPGGKVVALDYAAEMVARARAKFGHLATFLVADVHTLGFPGESYDLVVCNAAFPHFADKPRAMAEMGRVLKEGGRLYVIHAVTREELNRFHAGLDGPVSGDMLPGDQEMAALARSAGLGDVDIQDGPRYYIMSARKGRIDHL